MDEVTGPVIAIALVFVRRVRADGVSWPASADSFIANLP